MLITASSERLGNLPMTAQQEGPRSWCPSLKLSQVNCRVCSKEGVLEHPRGGLGGPSC